MLGRRSTTIVFLVLYVGVFSVFPGNVNAQDLISQEGVAAYYSNVFQGRRTASGDRYDKNALTAAHNSYAFGTQLRVTNLANGKSVVVRVNDRGPSTPGRIIDLSRRAADELGYLREGLTEVRLEVLETAVE